MNPVFASKGNGTWGPWIDCQQVDRGSDALLFAAIQASQLLAGSPRHQYAVLGRHDSPSSVFTCSQGM